MALIKNYEVILKGDRGNSLSVKQLEGQKLIILLCQNERPEYALVNGNCIATNMIAAIKEIPPAFTWKNGKLESIDEIRELTDEEKRVEAIFNSIQGKKLLN
jgi:hypothetical protein